MVKVVFQLIGAMLMFFTSIGGVITFSISNLFQDEISGFWIGLFSFWIIAPLLFSVYLLVQGRKGIIQFQMEQLELRIVKFAAQQEGRFSRSDLALKLHLSGSKIERIVDWMQNKQMIEPLVTPDGVIIYELRGYSTLSNEATRVI